MVHPHQLHTKGVAQLDDLMLLRFELMILRLVATIGLGHSALQHTQCKGCAIDWCRQLGDDMPKGTDMVEMPVGKDMRPNLVLILLQPLRIGDDVVDAWVVAAWEEEAHVDDDNIVVVLDGRHVLANTHLAHPANRDNLERWARSTGTLGLHVESKLLAAIAIVDRLIDRHINDMLRGLGIDPLAGAALCPKDLAFARGSGAQYCVGCRWLFACVWTLLGVICLGCGHSSLTHCISLLLIHYSGSTNKRQAKSLNKWLYYSR